MSDKEWPLKYQVCDKATHDSITPCCHKCPYCGANIKTYYETLHMLVCRERKEKEENNE